MEPVKSYGVIPSIIGGILSVGLVLGCILTGNVSKD